jgi:hypothetical protein
MKSGSRDLRSSSEADGQEIDRVDHEMPVQISSVDPLRELPEQHEGMQERVSPVVQNRFGSSKPDSCG